MVAVGVIGLGIMGGPIAANLVKAGFDVNGYNRSRPAIDRLTAAGGRAALSIGDAVRESEVVITMLPDSPDVESVVLGRGGVLEHAKPGLILIDMSTVRPQTAIDIAAAAAQKGVRTLDAPVSGGQAGAIDATLSIMVGGDAATYEAARPVLSAVGTTISHVGPAGAGQKVKAANQLIVAGTIQLIAEAIVLLESGGVDARTALQVLAGGLAGSRVLDRRAESMLARDYTPGFRIDLHHKDLGIMLDLARDTGAAVPVGALVAQLLAAARAQGHGPQDHTALLHLVEQLSGRHGG